MEDLIYLYGLIPTAELIEGSLTELKGFDEESEIYPISIASTTAVVCRLSGEKYSEEKIKDLIENDMQWLQEKAFHHHDTVINLSKKFTTLPLKFCTIYKNERNLTETVKANQDKMEKTFALLAGKEEWNLKIYCDDSILKEKVSKDHPVILEKMKAISHLSKGKQFFEKKKIDKLVDGEVEAEKTKISEKIHLQLKDFVVAGDIKRNWNKDVTGRQENMTWNSVYLIAESNVEAFLQEIQQYQRKMEESGWKFEATGPWPAYHFSSFS